MMESNNPVWSRRSHVGDCKAGCTDPDAINFDVSAVEDDGTCEYFACEDYENLVLVYFKQTFS